MLDSARSCCPRCGWQCEVSWWHDGSVCFHGVRAQTFALIVTTSQVEANMVNRKVAAVRRKVGKVSVMGALSTLATSRFWHEVQVLWEGAS